MEITPLLGDLTLKQFGNTGYSERLLSYFDMSEVNGRGLLKLEIKEEGVGDLGAEWTVGREGGRGHVRTS